MYTTAIASLRCEPPAGGRCDQKRVNKRRHEPEASSNSRVLWCVRGSLIMALEAETVLRPFPAAGGDGEVSGGAAAPLFLATERGRPVDPIIWGDEKGMKRELVAWAKAVASMAASKNTSSSSPSPSMRRRV